MSQLQRLSRRAAARAIPTVLERMFDPVCAAGLVAEYELRVTGPEGGVEDRFGLGVNDGRLTVTRGPAPAATAWVAISLRDMLSLVDGTAVLWELMAAKRLEIGGEPFTALRFPALFGLTG